MYAFVHYKSYYGDIRSQFYGSLRPSLLHYRHSEDGSVASDLQADTIYMLYFQQGGGVGAPDWIYKNETNCFMATDKWVVLAVFNGILL